MGAAGLLAGVGLAALLVIPNVSAYRTLANVTATPNVAWTDALYWLRHNTPEPFGDPQVYYSSFYSGSRGQVSRPRAAYGVLSWWDYGYWIARMGRRVPIANPKQTGVREAASFLLAEDESEAAVLADAIGARYVVTNWELQALLGQDNEIQAGFLADMAGAHGARLTRYIRVAYKIRAGELQPLILYEPAYYRTMMSRMYRAAPVSSLAQREAAWAVTLEERTRNGSPYLELVDETFYSDYEEARAFVEAAHSPNVRLVGKDPFVSCVPLPPLQEFTRAFRSLDRILYEGRAGPSLVQIFERVPATVDETRR